MLEWLTNKITSEIFHGKIVKIEIAKKDVAIFLVFNDSNRGKIWDCYCPMEIWNIVIGALLSLWVLNSLQPEYIYYSVFTAGNILWFKGSSLVNNPLFSFWCPEADLKIEINRQRNFHPIALAARVFQAKSKTFLWSLRFLS